MATHTVKAPVGASRAYPTSKLHRAQKTTLRFEVVEWRPAFCKMGAVDLSAVATVTLRGFRDPREPVADALFVKAGAVIDAAEGVAEVTLDPADLDFVGAVSSELLLADGAGDVLYRVEFSFSVFGHLTS